MQQQPVFREGGGGVSIGERAKKIQVLVVVVVVVVVMVVVDMVVKLMMAAAK